MKTMKTVRIRELSKQFRPLNCKLCGKENEADARFCKSCGTPVEPDQSDMVTRQPAATRSLEDKAREARLTLYKRNDVRRFLALHLKIGGDIQPQRDADQGEYIYHGVQEIGTDTSVAPLTELESHRILEKYIVDKVPACRHCGHTNFFVDYLCPFGQHRNLDLGTMIEHYSCSHTDFEANFKLGDALICPKCSKELKLLGTDYRKIGRLYRCSRCERFFGAPLIEFTCRTCNASSRADEVMIQPVYGYRINEKLRSEIVAYCTLEAQLTEILTQRGYEIAASKTTRGNSGIDHIFDMLAFKDDHEIAFDVVSSEKPNGPREVLSFFAKVFDTKPKRAILLAMPGIDRDARKLAQLYGVEVVEGENNTSIIEGLVIHLTTSEWSNRPNPI